MSNPVVIGRAPVRVDPAGGGTDCPPFNTEYGGAVLNFGITHYVYACLEILQRSSEVVISSEDFGVDVRADSVDALQIDKTLDLLKCIAKRMNPPWGFHLTVRSEVPPGSGLGGSGAVAVACVGAFDQAMGIKRTKAETAELANSIERKDLGAAGGSQDSYAAAFGGINLITYHKNGGTCHRHPEVPSSTFFDLERRCILANTGKVHLSGSILADVKKSYSLPNSPTLDAMKNLARIGNEGCEALEKGDIDGFGELLNQNWKYFKRLHKSCDSKILQDYFAAASEHIIGGKTCGAGGGGCVLFLAKDGHQRALNETCRKLGGQTLHFGIDQRGLVCWSSHP